MALAAKAHRALDVRATGARGQQVTGRDGASGIALVPTDGWDPGPTILKNADLALIAPRLRAGAGICFFMPGDGRAGRMQARRILGSIWAQKPWWPVEFELFYQR